MKRSILQQTQRWTFGDCAIALAPVRPDVVRRHVADRIRAEIVRRVLADGRSETMKTLTGKEECPTCLGAGRITDSDDSTKMRKCLDCNGSGESFPQIQAWHVEMATVRPGDKEINIYSIGDDNYHMIRITVSRDDCDTHYAEACAAELVKLWNASLREPTHAE